MQSWLAGGNTTLNVDAKVADHIVKNANAKLKEAVRRNFEDPESHLHWFSECIHYIDSSSSSDFLNVIRYIRI